MIKVVAGVIVYAFIVFIMVVAVFDFEKWSKWK